jgi:hypothetical protein
MNIIKIKESNYKFLVFIYKKTYFSHERSFFIINSLNWRKYKKIERIFRIELGKKY